MTDLEQFQLITRLKSEKKLADEELIQVKIGSLQFQNNPSFCFTPILPPLFRSKSSLRIKQRQQKLRRQPNSRPDMTSRSSSLLCFQRELGDIHVKELREEA